MERPIFHLRWERKALYRRKQDKKHARVHTHLDCAGVGGEGADNLFVSLLNV